MATVARSSRAVPVTASRAGSSSSAPPYRRVQAPPPRVAHHRRRRGYEANGDGAGVLERDERPPLWPPRQETGRAVDRINEPAPTAKDDMHRLLPLGLS
jgi:hypothetical protein